MRNILSLLLSNATLFFAYFVPLPAYAQVPTIPPQCPDGTVPSELGCVPSNVVGFVGHYYGFGLSLIGGVALLLIMYGAYLVLTSAGNPKQVNNGKDYIGYALAGLLLAIFGYFFVEVLTIDILKIPGFGSTP